jgi:hypothetical protein
MSPFIFRHARDEWPFWATDLGAGLAIVVFALASYWRPLRYAHLAILLVAGWLVGFGRFYGSPPLAPALQNDILVGLLLMLLAIVPNEAGEPPRAWRTWLHNPNYKSQ